MVAGRTTTERTRGVWLTAPLMAAMLGITGMNDTAAASSPPIEIAAQLRHAAGQLELSWLLANRSREAQWVLTQPLEHDGRPAPQRVYVRQADEHTAEFSLQLFAVPPGVGVTVLDRIGGTVLAPGATLAGEAVLRWPLQSQVPYLSSAPLAPSVRQWRLCVGVIDPARAPAAGAALRHEASTAALQRVVCSAPVPMPQPR
jgi:hypothetical protein